MDHATTTTLVQSLLLVLAAGLVAGAICRRLGVSLIVGFLLVGVVLGDGGLRMMAGAHVEIELLAYLGALFLLFAIGVELSLAELWLFRRDFVVAGALQMTLVAAPVTAGCRVAGLGWRGALVVGAAVAFSSTVLVFKALLEHGAAEEGAGRRAIGILLFQDVALVPVMLLVPGLGNATGSAPSPDARALAAGAYVLAVVVAWPIVRRVVVPLLGELRSRELVLLFALTILGGSAYGAQVAGLPPPLGAFVAGLMLSGTRLTRQVDGLLLPFREAFAALFFVSVGMLLRPAAVLAHPAAAVLGTAGVIAVKTLAAAVALRAARLPWGAAFGMGLGLSQLGEFGFIVLSEALRAGAIPAGVYDGMLAIALTTLLLTPQMVRWGLALARREPAPDALPARPKGGESGTARAVVIGAGPIGRTTASGLETRGFEVTLVDRSPLNLHGFAQLGFSTVTGDALESDVLERAGVPEAEVVMVAVPDDAVAARITARVRALTPHAVIVVRCRYQRNAGALRDAGAALVVSEESEAVRALGDVLARFRPR